MASSELPIPTDEPPRETIVTVTVISARPLTADEMLRRARVWALKEVHERFPDRGVSAGAHPLPHDGVLPRGGRRWRRTCQIMSL
jgi:hypothetical protein